VVVVHALGRLEEGVDVGERAVVHAAVAVAVDVAGQLSVAAGGGPRLRGGDVAVAGGRAAAQRRGGLAVAAGRGAAGTANAVTLSAGRGGGGGHALDGLGRHGGGGQRVEAVGERAAGREVEVRRGRRASEAEQRGVVGARRGLGGGVGAEPDPRLLARRPHLRHPRAPAPHPHALVRPLISAAVPRRRRRRGRRRLHHGLMSCRSVGRSPASSEASLALLCLVPVDTIGVVGGDGVVAQGTFFFFCMCVCVCVWYVPGCTAISDVAACLSACGN
jgi:hypothetical protein